MFYVTYMEMNQAEQTAVDECSAAGGGIQSVRTYAYTPAASKFHLHKAHIVFLQSRSRRHIQILQSFLQDRTLLTRFQVWRLARVGQRTPHLELEQGAT